MALHPDSIASLVKGTHGAPFDLLGRHPAGDGQVSLRAFRPDASEMYAVEDGTKTRVPMHKQHEAGFYEVTVSGEWSRYQYEIVTHDGRALKFADPYRYPIRLGEFDVHLLREGRDILSYKKFGAHLHEMDGVKGVRFMVWAPNAYRLGIIGDFNNWDARTHPMQAHDDSGIWQLFIPGLGEGDCYKYDIRSRFHDYHAEKIDPYAFAAERRPKTASVVANLDSYKWNDSAWMAERATRKPLASPMSIYEAHLGSWRRNEDGSWLTYRELADTLVKYVSDMGYTHIELMPVAEHPFDGSWGYQVTGYFAATSRYGSPQDFMYFVDQCHRHNIGVILDWVPAHFPKDGHALSYFDGTHLYEHADPRKGEHPDWGTLIFNYGRNEVRNFLLSNALFWLKMYHIDGLRVDAVSSMLYLDFSRDEGKWLPNEYGGNENLDAISFIKELNTIAHSECPGAITIAEESTSWPMVSRPTYIGGLGFTFKWNMGWMHDTLDYISTDPLYRRYAHNKLTFSLFYAFSENFVLSLSHDEVVHGKGSLMGKMSGDWWQKFAGLRLLTGYQYTHPGKKLNFMGHEIGQWREWSEERGLDWNLLELETHSKLNAWMCDLNKFYKTRPALYELDSDPRGFRWIEPNDAEQSVFSYIRFAADVDHSADDPGRQFLVIACNFTPMPRYNYRIGVPAPGRYAEVLNSDSAHYGGGNIGNMGSLETAPIRWHNAAHSLSLTIPPLAIIVLKHTSAGH